jgi:Ca-activated chloride channel family protein
MQTPFGIRYQMVPVDLDESALSQIAEMTGGKYFRATDNKKLKAIYQEIDKMEKSRVEVRSYRRHTELFYSFALIACFVLLVDAGLSQTYFRKIP